MKTPAEILTPGCLQKNCRECGKEFEIDPDYASVARFVSVCPACSEVHALEDQRRTILNSKSLREEGWNNICPKEFRETVPHRLPHPHSLDMVLRWQFGAKGLILHGATGSGKSRCAWVLLKREYVAGRSLRHLDYMAGIEYAERFHESPRAVREWMESMISTQLLFLDDIFKAKFTDSFENSIFSIISRRTEHGKPCILTTNDTGESLGERLSPDRFEPLTRRLREFCTSISFD